MKKLCIVLGVSLLLLSCAAPKTFVKTMDPTWASIEFRTDVTYDKAWTTIMDILVRRFDIEVAQKENGYIRTAWLYTWLGSYDEYYRVRVTVKISKEKNSVDVKSEAFYKDYVGYDTQLLQTLKTDVMGAIGRITR